MIYGFSGSDLQFIEQNKSLQLSEKCIMRMGECWTSSKDFHCWTCPLQTSVSWRGRTTKIHKNQILLENCPWKREFKKFTNKFSRNESPLAMLTYKSVALVCHLWSTKPEICLQYLSQEYFWGFHRLLPSQQDVIDENETGSNCHSIAKFSYL